MGIRGEHVRQKEQTVRGHEGATSGETSRIEESLCLQQGRTGEVDGEVAVGPGQIM